MVAPDTAEEHDREWTEGDTNPPTHPRTQSFGEMTFNRAIRILNDLYKKYILKNVRTKVIYM